MLLAALTLATQTVTPIELNVDATQASLGVVRVLETVPVRGGTTVRLSYPKWIPGEHQPSGPINQVVRFKATADGKELPWTRDPKELFTMRVPVPKDASSIRLEFTVAAPGGDAFAPVLGRIKWNRMVFLPDGPMDAIQVRAILTPPAGWTVNSALPGTKAGASTVFETATAERLVDSPAQIGKNARTFDLGNGAFLDLLTDDPGQLDLKPETLQACKNLVAQALKLTGAKHWRQYRFLLTISENGANEGLEHHESSEDGDRAAVLTAEGLHQLGDLLAHEMFHSWNGKYRRPKGLVTPTFQDPQETELLWVYEGLTQYYGNVLNARAGFAPQEHIRDLIASEVGWMDDRPGRAWRPVADTATAASILRNPGGWDPDRRAQDYYNEAVPIWMEADATIRTLTHGAKSLDDFVRLFHGGADSAPTVKTYEFNDVVSALSQVAPFDWAGFLRKRIYDINPAAPVGGLEAAGWRLVYNDAPNVAEQYGAAQWGTDHHHELGLLLDKDGKVSDVVIDSPAYRAGVIMGSKLIAVSGKEFTSELLDKAIAAKAPVELVFSRAGSVSTVIIDYRGGLRRPHIERIADRPDLLSEILKAK